MFSHEIKPGEPHYLAPGEEIATPDETLKNSIVCQWPSDLPLTMQNWNKVFNHFREHGQFLSLAAVRSIVNSND